MQESTTQKYDFIIAGMGASGLSLAIQLQKSKVNFKKILLIDKALKNTNDRTWCFWSKENEEWYNPIIYKKWDKFEFKSNYYQNKFELKPYSYILIRGIDFYNYCLNELKNDSRFEIKTEEIINIKSENEQGILQTNNNIYSAKYIFNSVFRNNNIHKKDINYVQHFKGWVIETEENSFNENCPVFMDFRTEQYNDCRFFYIIPFSNNRALVEYTGFSPKVLNISEYENKLKNYLEKTLNISKYSILETEYGEIPMMESDFINPYGKQVINIGTAGGSSKTSTGYTFYFIQKNTKEIIYKLEINEDIRDYKRSNRFKLYDSVLLDVINNQSVPSDKLFTYLFKNNNLTNILDFLNEETKIFKDILIMNSVPKLPFLKSTFKKVIELYEKRK